MQDFINFVATLKHEKNVKNEIKLCQNWSFLAKNWFKVARFQRVLDKPNIFIKNRTEKTISAVFFF